MDAVPPVPVKREPLVGYDYDGLRPRGNDPFSFSESLPPFDMSGRVVGSPYWDMHCYDRKGDLVQQFHADPANSFYSSSFSGSFAMVGKSFLDNQASFYSITTSNTVPLQETLSLPFPVETGLENGINMDYGRQPSIWEDEIKGFSWCEAEQLLMATNNQGGIEIENEGEGEGKEKNLNERSGSSDPLKSTTNFTEEYSSCSRKVLTWEAISKHFYSPIADAAKALNIGVTLLKKRCRELGIRRWPHRKLMSLEALIEYLKKNVGEEDEDNLRRALEREKKLIEEVPDLQLEDNTKRLRQACFKANHKKRKLHKQSYNGLGSAMIKENPHAS
ncbi:hypothetical protein SAY86_006112 [Trapa natans]|uniref:RWP-RK domain-containing protein n=1 Tax=Trapa natans TaxID=22666 RepID=A0AAN7L5Z2_TRANT|nr:hypothetical protein SAY86_006112 [Trapa natans]